MTIQHEMMIAVLPRFPSYREKEKNIAMDKMTKFKEAVKIALAFTLVYWITLKMDWNSPSYAGYAVAMIALPTAGQSIQKGLLRLSGTIPGCLGGLAILCLAPQDRWVFILLASAWFFSTSYLMIADKKRSYMWAIAAYTCFVITLAGPGSSQAAFTNAVYRALETGLGIMVYTLICVFIWPRNNKGAIHQAGIDLMATLALRCRTMGDMTLGENTQEDLSELQIRVTRQFGHFTQALQAEGAENYEVYEVKHLWGRFHCQSSVLIDLFARWQSDLEELVRMDVHVFLPDLATFVDGLEARLEEIRGYFEGEKTVSRVVPLSLTLRLDEINRLSTLDRAALAMVKKELETIEELTRAMLACSQKLLDLPGDKEPTESGQTFEKAQPTHWLLPDPEALKGGLFVATCCFIGFLVWVFIDPPGHSGWYMLPGTFGLIFAGSPQLRASILIKPLAVMLTITLGLYVLVMPQLSSFAGLGTLLFISMFAARFLLPGAGGTIASMAILNNISVQNQQVYNFAAMANSSLSTVMAVALTFGVSYIMSSSRPQKVVPHMVGRFFRGAKFLVRQAGRDPIGSPGMITRWKTAFYRREMQTLPEKINSWGNAINTGLFPGNTPDQIQQLIVTMQSLTRRVEQLLETAGTRQAEYIIEEMGEKIRAWQTGLYTILEDWSRDPGAGFQLSAQLEHRLMSLEDQMNEAIEKIDRDKVTQDDGERFYRLMGGLRGISRASVVYASAAAAIDWDHWQEEVFS